MSRIVVVGAGAIGGVVGGLLIEAGEEVAFVARGDHGRAIAERGLTVRRPQRTLTVRPAAVLADVEELEGREGDVVLLGVKTQDTELVLRGLARVLRDDAVIVCLQNGLDNERMALRRFANVIGCNVMLPALHLTPGEVVAFSTPTPGSLDVGPAARSASRDDAEAVAARLTAAGFSSIAQDDVMAWKRTKLTLNLANASKVLEGSDALVKAARVEAHAVLDAAGLPYVGPEPWEQRREGIITPVDVVDGIDRPGSSTIQSLQRGGEVETDFLNGEIVLLGRLHGVPTPANVEICAQLRRLSAGGPASSSTG